MENNTMITTQPMLASVAAARVDIACADTRRFRGATVKTFGGIVPNLGSSTSSPPV